MKSFNFRGVIFEVLYSWEDGKLYIEAVYHKGEDLTEVLAEDTRESMEESLTREIAADDMDYAKGDL